MFEIQVAPIPDVPLPALDAIAPVALIAPISESDVVVRFTLPTAHYIHA